jgi:hypothetical protein
MGRQNGVNPIGEFNDCLMERLAGTDKSSKLSHYIGQRMLHG